MQFRLALIFLVILSCTSEIIEGTDLPVNEFLLNSPDRSPLPDHQFFYSNLAYGPQQAHRFDLLLPTDLEPSPAVILFHGGRFIDSSRKEMYEMSYKGILQNILARDIAVLNATYTQFTI